MDCGDASRAGLPHEHTTTGAAVNANGKVIAVVALAAPARMVRLELPFSSHIAAVAICPIIQSTACITPSSSLLVVYFQMDALRNWDSAPTTACSQSMGMGAQTKGPVRPSLVG